MKEKMNMADKHEENSDEDQASAGIRIGTPESNSSIGARKVSTEDSS